MTASPAANISSTAPNADVDRESDRKSVNRSLTGDEKMEVTQCVEDAKSGVPGVTGAYIPPEEIRARFPLLRDLSEEQLTALNKKVVSKIDWHMMPCVTLMFLMK
jgi:hypothetical protein